MDSLCPLVILVSLVAGTEAFEKNVTSPFTGVNKGPGAHTIQNDNPYQGLDVTHEGHRKYSIIFEPLQNIQMSRSTYRVTSFIDFDPYLQYFANFELYLKRFLKNLESFTEDPVFREFRWGSTMVCSGKEGMDCSKRPKCEAKTLLFEVRNQRSRMEAYRIQRERCIARHFQVCLALKNFDHLLNVTLQLYQNFEKVKNRFLRAVDHVEQTHDHAELGKVGKDREKRAAFPRGKTQVAQSELNFIRKTLIRIGSWEPKLPRNATAPSREKRFLDILAGIGSIVNAVQIKKIEILKSYKPKTSSRTKRDELARFMNLTATRVRLHDKQIYNLQVRMMRLEQGLQEMTDATNFHIYASHQINMAQAAIFRLQLGLGTAEANIERIFEYLRIMATQRASPAVIPPVAFRDLVKRIRAKLKANPRLSLPYDPDTAEIWKYYRVMKITPVVIDKLLVILLTLPILDSTLELNVYRAHNLPAIPPAMRWWPPMS